MFSAPDFSLTDVVSSFKCLAATPFMRQEGFLTHPAEQEVKFFIIEILVNTCQHNQPSSGCCHIIMAYGKNHLGPLNHCCKIFEVKGDFFGS